jgi:hypothetical protein
LSNLKFQGNNFIQKAKYRIAIIDDIINDRDILIHTLKKDGGEVKHVRFSNNKTKSEWEEYLKTTENPIFLYEDSSITATRIVKQPYSKVSVKDPTGEQWEQLICYQWNKTYSHKLSETKTITKHYSNTKDILEKICSNLENEIQSREMMYIMGNNKNIKLNEQWISKNKTSKTDLYIGKYNISLKKKGGCQLASGKSEEVISIFNAIGAFELASMIEDTITYDYYALESCGGFRDLKKELKVREPSMLEDKITKMDCSHKVITEKVNKYFSLNPHKLFLFCEEVLTGKSKFLDSRAKSSHILSFDSNTGCIDFLELSKEVITDISNNMRSYFSFKNSNSRLYSVLRVNYI